MDAHEDWRMRLKDNYDDKLTYGEHFDELIAETWVEFGYKPPGY